MPAPDRHHREHLAGIHLRSRPRRSPGPRRRTGNLGETCSECGTRAPNESVATGGARHERGKTPSQGRATNSISCGLVCRPHPPASSNGKSYQSISSAILPPGRQSQNAISPTSATASAGTAAIELALKHKDHSPPLPASTPFSCGERFRRAVWTAAEMVRRVGLPQALGSGFAGHRRAGSHRPPLGAGFPSLRRPPGPGAGWRRCARHSPRLRRQPSEGEDNAFGAYGYHRDGKKGKKQIVHAGLHGSVPRQ